MKRARETSAQGVDTVVVLDYGSQYTQLIARRVRELGAYSVLLPGDATAARIASHAPKAIVLSGGPNSVHAEGAPSVPKEFFEYVEERKIPVLGICYGMLMPRARRWGASWSRAGSPSTDGCRWCIRRTGARCTVERVRWGRRNRCGCRTDEATQIAAGFACVGKSEGGAVVAVEDAARNLYGLQYHPEVTHSEKGLDTLKRFLFDIAGVKAEWSMANVLDEQIEIVKNAVGPDAHVICALSGGVDSAVAATLVHKAIGDRLHCVFVDNGLLRFKEQEPRDGNVQEPLAPSGRLRRSQPANAHASRRRHRSGKEA